jgi:DNA-binding transcriptional regulator YhcF (GntR family)
MALIRINDSSGVPIYKQIVDQVEYMIEAGQLVDGDRLPSSRMLAANLSINRNTVARAYAELRDQGYVDARRRSGMIVSGAGDARHKAHTREEAREILKGSVARCLELGLTPDEISSLAYHHSLQVERLEVKVSFVECNAERSEYFARELTEQLDIPVAPLVLSEFDPSILADDDLVLTTFFHLSETRRLANENGRDGSHPEVAAIVVAPHVRTLVRVAQLPKGSRLGILYSTRDQAESIQQSFAQANLSNVDIIDAQNDDPVVGYDIVVIPSEHPDLRKRLPEGTEVIEFGNVLDAGSIKMVRDIIDEIRDRKAVDHGVAASKPGAGPQASAAAAAPPARSRM